MSDVSLVRTSGAGSSGVNQAMRASLLLREHVEHDERLTAVAVPCDDSEVPWRDASHGFVELSDASVEPFGLLRFADEAVGRLDERTVVFRLRGEPFSDLCCGCPECFII